MKNKKVRIGVVALLLICGGAGGYYFFLGPGAAEAAEEPPPEPAAIVALDPFLTNIADQRRARVEVTLAVAPVERAAEIQEDPLLVARLRDKVLTMLSARTFGELSEGAGKERFRKQIRDAAQKIIEEGEVREALFVDFVVQ